MERNNKKTNLDSRCLVIYSCYSTISNQTDSKYQKCLVHSFHLLMFTGMKQSSGLVGIYQWGVIVNKGRKPENPLFLLLFTTLKISKWIWSSLHCSIPMLICIHLQP